MWQQATLIPAKVPGAAGSTGPLGLGSKLPDTDSNKKTWVWDEFAPDPGLAKKGKCRHCNTPPLSMLNITRMKEHLMNPRVCGFLKSEAAQSHPNAEVQAAVAHIRQQDGKLRSMARSASTSGAGSAAASDAPCVSTFIMDRMAAKEHKELQHDFAKMVYLTGLPLSWVEHEAVQVRIPELSQLCTALLHLLAACPHCSLP